MSLVCQAQAYSAMFKKTMTAALQFAILGSDMQAWTEMKCFIPSLRSVCIDLLMLVLKAYRQRIFCMYRM